MERSIREHYEQLIQDTVDEGTVAGWDREELKREVEKLRRVMGEERKVLREGCYEGIFKNYGD